MYAIDLYKLYNIETYHKNIAFTIIKDLDNNF